MNTNKEFICCICGEHITGQYGNNPFPVSETGQCCDDCNINTVIPERIKQHGIVIKR